MDYLDFEKPVYEIQSRIDELRKLQEEGGISLQKEIDALQTRAEELKKEIFSNLTAWERTKIARHPRRPYTRDYVQRMISEFQPLTGDRAFSEDLALEAGTGFFEGRPVMVIGHQKGRETRENLARNFGMAHPEGYRKSLRLMKLAEKFGFPVITLIDTPGAYPGIGAEERGQASAIAVNLREMSLLKVPIISVIIGEGGSGGALGIGVGDRVYMMENSVYSVISPEGCAAILFKDASRARDAAQSLKISAKDILELGVIDGIIPEPLGGAHEDYDQAAENLKTVIRDALRDMEKQPRETLPERRYEKLYRLVRYKKKNLSADLNSVLCSYEPG